MYIYDIIGCSFRASQKVFLIRRIRAEESVLYYCWEADDGLYGAPPPANKRRIVYADAGPRTMVLPFLSLVWESHNSCVFTATGTDGGRRGGWGGGGQGAK